MHPKISIITATYNCANTLEQTICSVIQQTYDNIEYVIIDGDSTDETVDIIKRYENRISYWVSEPDKGIYDAFNKGVCHSSGDYIYFIGSDDCLFDKFTIEKIAKQIWGADILSGGVWCVDGKRRVQNYVTGKRAGRIDYDFSMIPHQGIFAKRELLVNNPFDSSYKIAADYLFFLRCYFDNKIIIKYIDMPVAFYSIDGISSNGEAELLIKENNQVRQIFSLPGQNVPTCRYKKVIKILLNKVHLLNCVRYLLESFARRNWMSHKCDWAICRWCNRNK